MTDDILARYKGDGVMSDRDTTLIETDAVKVVRRDSPGWTFNGATMPSSNLYSVGIQRGGTTQFTPALTLDELAALRTAIGDVLDKMALDEYYAAAKESEAAQG
ncbi:MAG TPA: hypothetical protein VHY91_13630 [Pirellulales bacterium]|jgi:hypothetical protein|nr:hypothetical protein [Pirellulales bacterium]